MPHSCGSTVWYWAVSINITALNVKLTTGSETFSVISYGLFNVLQHSTFMLQWVLNDWYDGDTDRYSQIHALRRDPRDERQFQLLVVARVPTRASHTRTALSEHDQYVSHRAVLGSDWQATHVIYFAALTNSFKPIAQVLSHLPQLAECIKLKTTMGCSLMSQHINFVGGLLGLFSKSYRMHWPRALTRPIRTH